MAKNKLKIGFVIDDNIDGMDGVQQHVRTVGKWLSIKGYEVHYLASASEGNNLANVHSLGRNLKVRFNGNRLNTPLPANKKLLKAKLKELDLDIIHVQMPYSPFLAGRIINLVSSKTKIIGTFHVIPANWLHHGGSHALRLLNRRTLKQFDQIISVSKAAADFARSTAGIESIVIPNPINLKTMKHKPIINKVPTIVFLGRLVERKGCRYLLKALAQLQKQYKGKYQVIIGGPGPLRAKLEKYAKDQKLKNVKFIGFVEEQAKSALLASADIAVFPSIGGESFGISLIEAMAAGARVTLGGDNAGYRCVLGEYPDSLVNAKKSKVFANRLQYFIEDKSARLAAAKWAKANVVQYDIEKVGPKIVAVYTKT